MSKRKQQVDMVAIYVPYGEVFGDALRASEVFDLFKRVIAPLSRTDTLFWCARLSLFLADPTRSDDEKDRFVRRSFTDEQNARIDSYRRKKRDSCVIVISRGALLELTRWVCRLCADQSGDGETFERPEARELFSRALLLGNELWAKRVYGSIPEGYGIPLVSLRRAIMETQVHPRPFDHLARGRRLFTHYLPQSCPGFPDMFRRATDLSADEYYRCACALFYFINSEARSNVGSTSQSCLFTLQSFVHLKPDMQTAMKSYLKLEGVSIDDFPGLIWRTACKHLPSFDEHFSLRGLRAKPILKASKDRMVIYDPPMFLEQASIGPRFHVTRGLNDSDAQKIMSAFGHAFEAYVGAILAGVYPDPGPGLVKRLYRDVRDRQNQNTQIADFLVNDVTDIVLIEAKAEFLNDNVISKDQVEAYIEELKRRYVTPDGCAQLATALAKIDVGQYQPDGVDISKANHFYPVLLVYDSLLDAHGHCRFLAQEFETLLQPSAKQGCWLCKGRFMVAPLTVMTVSDLEVLASSLDGFSLVSLLFGYAKEYPDRNVSLNNFLVLNQDKFPVKFNRSLTTESDSMLAELMCEFQEAATA